jgi:hypothetical protein
VRNAVTTGMLAFVAVAAVLVAAGPASAKGPVSAIITGPGIDESIDVVEVVSADDTGVWLALSDMADPAVLPTAPKTDLGPRHTLVWKMSGPQGSIPVHQYLYLEADGGPLAYTEPGQPFIDGVTTEQWYRMPSRVRDALAAEGVPLDGLKPGKPAAGAETGNNVTSDKAAKDDKAAKGAAADEATSPRAAGPQASRDPVWPTATAAAVGAVVVGAGGVAVVRRAIASRERRRVDAIPL